LEAKPELGAGKDGLGFIKLIAEMAENLIVSRLGEMVQFHGQCSGVEVGNQISIGVIDLPQQSASIVGARHFFSEDGHHAGFRAIADHLDRVDEALSFRAQSGEAILLRQVFDGNVMRGRLAFLLQFFQLALELFDFLLLLALDSGEARDDTSETGSVRLAAANCARAFFRASCCFCTRFDPMHSVAACSGRSFPEPTARIMPLPAPQRPTAGAC
jgi:hypothetical protein